MSLPCVGTWDPYTVMLDLDDTPLEEAKQIARTVMQRFDLEGFRIFESSPDNHHAVFNKPVRQLENIAIVASTVRANPDKPKLNAWFLRICERNHPILRNSWKGAKPPPLDVYNEGKQDRRIRRYLYYRNIVLNPQD